MKSIENNTIADSQILSNNYFFATWNYNDHFECNNSFEEKLGYTKEELLAFPNKHHSLIEEEEEQKRIIESLIEHDFEESSEEIIKNYKIISKNGKPVWLKEYISKIKNDNKNTFSSLVVDISEHMQKEIELNEIISQKTKLNDSKNKLISIISHDLRAPFTSLLGFSEILLNEPNLSEEERKEYLEYIHDASQIQLQMVNHLLDWTRLQTGAMRFEPRRIEIRDIIENSISVLTGVAIRKNIEIKVEGGKGVFVNVDEKLISQAVTNLIGNAIKFTPSGKKIKVIIGFYKTDMVEVNIKDEGVGISESNQLKLFKVDVKYSQTGTAGEKGSGLGLTLVKEIIEKHKGNIWLYSELQKGSEFHFTIPKSEDSILIVEEHEEMQKEYTKAFQKIFPNFRVDFVKSGFDALNFISTKTPSIIISYHSMPLMNGIQLATSLRKKDNYNKVTVIILVDNLSDNEKNEYKKYKVENFINFKSMPIEIAEALKKILF